MQALNGVIEVLRQHGVDTVFALLGDANLHLGLAIDEAPSMRLVAATHEASAVAMAAGYAHRTGRVGVATVTRGPGLSNSITALTEAVRMHDPVLLLVGDRAAGAPDHAQDIDHRAVVAPTGAGFIDVAAGDDITRAVTRAAYQTGSEQRPVVLNLPIDVQREAKGSRVDVQAAAGAATANVLDPAGVDEAVGVALSSQRPLVLAGWGAVRSGAAPALRALAGRLGAALATTLPARGLFHGDPADIGVFGTLSTPAAVELIGSADCILAFGASLNRHTTADSAYLKGRAVVHCNLAAEGIGPSPDVTCTVAGDAREVAEGMLALIEEAGLSPRDFRANHVEPVIAGYDPSSHFVDASTVATIDPRTLTLALADLLPECRTTVVDAGRFMRYPLTHLSIVEPRALLTTLGFAPIGLAVPMAMGAAVGQPDQPAVALTGDGAFMLGGLAEFTTAVREGVDLVVIVFNDGSYGAEHSKLLREGLDPKVTTFEWPDLAAIASLMGGCGVTVRTPADLERARTAVWNRTTPVLLDCHIDPQIADQASE